MKNVGIMSYGLQITTLEEVYLKIAHEDDGSTNDLSYDNVSTPEKRYSKIDDSAGLIV